jgi:hypothetical protein
MGRLTETVSTINSTLRTLLATLMLGVLGAGSYVVWDKVTQGEQALQQAEARRVEAEADLREANVEIATLRDDLVTAQLEIDRLDTSMRLLKMDQRLARLDVIDKQIPAEGEEGTVKTTVRFSELSPDGDAIGEPREFTVEGDVIYLDNWVVKFEDEFVEQAHLQRGTSLALFRRLFGEFQKPADGYPLDDVGGMPQAYRRGGDASEFEQDIWSQFWTFANDREKARAAGIRAAHGEAVSIRAEKGRSYRIVLRASDGLSIIPVESD